MRNQVMAAATAIVLGITTISTYGMAAGTDMHEMEDTLHASAAVTPEVAPSHPFLGCGSYRHYDAKTRTCRGPGNF
jgi:hypothetical protein